MDSILLVANHVSSSSDEDPESNEILLLINAVAMLNLDCLVEQRMTKESDDFVASEFAM